MYTIKGDEMDQIHIRIDEEMKKEIKVKAAKDGVSLTELIIKFLKQWLRSSK